LPAVSVDGLEGRTDLPAVERHVTDLDVVARWVVLEAAAVLALKVGSLQLPGLEGEFDGDVLRWSADADVDARGLVRELDGDVGQVDGGGEARCEERCWARRSPSKEQWEEVEHGVNECVVEECETGEWNPALVKCKLLAAGSRGSAA
jgi:hypothetical protein